MQKIINLWNRIKNAFCAKWKSTSHAPTLTVNVPLPTFSRPLEKKENTSVENAGWEDEDILEVAWPVDHPRVISAVYKQWGEHWGWIFDEKTGLWQPGRDKRGYGQHRGVDLACPEGTLVRATVPGLIDFIGHDTAPNGGFGLYIRQNSEIEGRKFRVYYAHLSRTKVKKGTYVYTGKIIGHSGNTGHSTGPHLHNEYRKTWDTSDKQSFGVEFV